MPCIRHSIVSSISHHLRSISLSRCINHTPARCAAAATVTLLLALLVRHTTITSTAADRINYTFDEFSLAMLRLRCHR